MRIRDTRLKMEDPVVGIHVSREGRLHYAVIDPEETDYANIWYVSEAEAAIIDDRVPARWVTALDDGGPLKIQPAAWMHPAFSTVIAGESHEQDGELGAGAHHVALTEAAKILADPGAPDRGLWDLIEQFRRDPDSVHLPAVDALAAYRATLREWASSQPEGEVWVKVRSGDRFAAIRHVDEGYLPVRPLRFRLDPTFAMWFSDPVVLAENGVGALVSTALQLYQWPESSEREPLELGAADLVIPDLDGRMGRIVGWADRQH